MPTVFIFEPNSSHKFGHAALRTDKYHISFWPDGDVKEDLGVVKTAVVGVDASLNFHLELDRYYEGKRRPTGEYEIVNVTDEAINGIHEEFLRYNKIDPADVTLEAAEEVIDNGGRPEMSVSRTPYTFIAAVEKTTMFDAVRPSNSPFYHLKQSCVSFCFNLINKADPNPQLHFPVSEMVSPSLFGGLSVRPENLIGMLVTSPPRNSGIFTVPWFEKYVVEHWMPDAKPNSCSIV
jgi:hypothetical protein